MVPSYRNSVFQNCTSKNFLFLKKLTFLLQFQYHHRIPDKISHSKHDFVFKFVCALSDSSTIKNAKFQFALVGTICIRRWSLNSAD